VAPANLVIALNPKSKLILGPGHRAKKHSIQRIQFEVNKKMGMACAAVPIF